MSITNIDLNFAANGSAHSATITEIVGSPSCGNSSAPMIANPQVGKPPQINHPEISRLLKNFVLETKTTQKDPRVTKKEYKYIDRLSVILESIVVAVRGINAPSITSKFSGTASFLNNEPPNSQLKFDGPIFACSEVIDTAFAYRYPAIMSGYGEYNKDNSFYDKERNLLILGATYSVISQEIKDQKSYQVYNKGVRIEALELDSRYTAEFTVEDEDGNSIIIDPLDSQKIDATKAVLKYGYTAKEFFMAMPQLGIEFVENPLMEKGDNLFDASGLLKDALSSICSYYGYYWYVDTAESGGKIRLVDSKEVYSHEIEDPTLSEDIDILNSSFTEGGRSAFNVLSFMGSTSPLDLEKGGFEMRDRMTSRNFWLIDIEKFINMPSAVSKAVALFYNFYNTDLAESIDPQAFDKYFYTACHTQKEIMEPLKDIIVASEGGKPLYSTQIQSPNTLKTLLEVLRSTLHPKYQAIQKNLSPSINAETAYFGAQYSKDKGKMEDPTSSSFYSFVSSFYENYGTLYVSNGVSKVFSERNEFTGGSYSISGPYRGSDLLANIDAAKDFVTMASFFNGEAKNLKVIDLVKQSGAKLGISSEKYFYLARSPRKVLRDKGLNAVETIDLNQCRLDNQTREDGLPAIAWSPNCYNSISSYINSSTARLKKESSSRKRNDRVIRVQASVVDNGPEGSSDDGEGERLPMEYAFQRIKTFGKNKFCKSDFKVFDGSIQDVKILESSSTEELGVIQNDQNSSSVTYNGLRIPEEIDIFVDSISIGFGENGITTTISKSNKNIIPQDQNIILDKGRAATVTNYRQAFSAGAKNYFRIH